MVNVTRMNYFGDGTNDIGSDITGNDIATSNEIITKMDNIYQGQLQSEIMENNNGMMKHGTTSGYPCNDTHLADMTGEESSKSDTIERDPMTYSVMTMFGPAPLPDEIRKKIPEKFVARPIIEEREIFVAKKEIQERTIEIPHVHYEHKYERIPQHLKVDKLIPIVKEVIKEIPRKIYKPVVAEKIIEVPQGIKYVEVPVEVPVQYPPKIVPKPTVQIVERVVETIKPVIKEKIVQVPQTVIKQIPIIKTVQVPYYVPKYVEKTIEVNYSPHGQHDPNMLLKHDLPMALDKMNREHYSKLSQNSSYFQNNNDIYQNITNSTTIQSGGIQNIPHIVSPGSSNLNTINSSNNSYQGNNKPIQTNDRSITNSNIINHHISFQNVNHPHLPEPPQHPVPDYIAHATTVPPPGMPYPKDFSFKNGQQNIKPLFVNCPPEIRNVTTAGIPMEPLILTANGVVDLAEFKNTGGAPNLMPPLASHPLVPFIQDQPGVPDMKQISRGPQTNTMLENMLKS